MPAPLRCVGIAQLSVSCRVGVLHEATIRHRRRRRLDYTADRRPTASTLLWFPVRHLVIHFHWRIVPVLGWLAAVVRIYGVALQRPARAPPGVCHARSCFFADREAADHHGGALEPRIRHSEAVLSMTTRPNNAQAPNVAMTPRLHSGHHQRGVGDLRL